LAAFTSFSLVWVIIPKFLDSIYIWP